MQKYKDIYDRSPLMHIKMSKDESYWANAFKFSETSYENGQWRSGPIPMESMKGSMDQHDFPVENSAMSNRGWARVYRNPFKGVPYPRECTKLIGRYYHCREDHGVTSIVDPSPVQCNDKKAVVFEDCPHWVLQNLAYKRKFFKRAEMVDRLTFERAMEVSDYNK